MKPASWSSTLTLCYSSTRKCNIIGSTFFWVLTASNCSLSLHAAVLPLCPCCRCVSRLFTTLRSVCEVSNLLTWSMFQTMAKKWPPCFEFTFYFLQYVQMDCNHSVLGEKLATLEFCWVVGMTKFIDCARIILTCNLKLVQNELLPFPNVFFFENYGLECNKTVLIHALVSWRDLISRGFVFRPSCAKYLLSECEIWKFRKLSTWVKPRY